MKFSILTFGCRAGQCDSDKLMTALLCAGHTLVTASAADVVFIKACMVTQKAEDDSLRAVRKYRDGCRVILTGCATDAAKAEAEFIPIKQLIAEYETDGLQSLKQERYPAKTRTRCFAKIQNGCNRSCGYCIVPSVTGTPESMPLLEFRELCRRESEYYKEIVLTGINLLMYADGIVEAVSTAARFFPRVRLSSVEPDLLTESDIAALAKIPQFCESFHMSLQSGSDKILRAMSRLYTAEEYAEKVALLRRTFKNCGITADIIVGYPGETREDFEESYEFARHMRFAKLHVFPYSPRAGTAAWSMPNQITAAEKTYRAQKLRGLSETLEAEFLREQRGQVSEILIEKPPKSLLKQYKTVSVGHSRSFCRFVLPETNYAAGEIVLYTA